MLLGELNQMIEVNGKDNGFITLKDHKEIFLSHLTTRLINPAKNKIGRIGKQMLERINNNLDEKVNLNEWKSTKNVINRFQSNQK